MCIWCSLQVAIAQIALGVLIDSQIHDKLAILLDKPFEYADFSQLAARYNIFILCSTCWYQNFLLEYLHNWFGILKIYVFRLNRNQLINELSAANLFVAWLKVYKYMSFNKTMATLTGTIAQVRCCQYFSNLSIYAFSFSTKWFIEFILNLLHFYSLGAIWWDLLWYSWSFLWHMLSLDISCLVSRYIFSHLI